MSTEFEIRDWTGKVCFNGKRFESFDDAWSFIYEADPNESDDEHYYDDYFVETCHD